MAWARCMLGECLVIGSRLCLQLGRVHSSELQYCYLPMSHWVGHSSHPSRFEVLTLVWSQCSELAIINFHVNFIKSLLHPFPGVRVSWDCFFFSLKWKDPLPSPFPPPPPSTGSTICEWTSEQGGQGSYSMTLLAQLGRLLVIWFMAITSTFKCPKNGEPQTLFKC